MPIGVIADAHIGGPGGGPGPLVEQLLGLRESDCTRLVLLGDLFHFWVGDPRYENADIRPVVEAIARLREGGLPVDYVEGNRDFFIAEGPYKELFDQVGQEVEFRSAGRRVLAVHGDGLDAKDRKYRLWRWLSKSLPVRLAARHLPASFANGLFSGTERQLARTNFKHKARIPEEVIREYASGRLAEGYDLLVMGHFHAPRTWEVAGGEVRILDAWFNSHRIEWFDTGA